MTRTILKDETKNIPYGTITYQVSSIVPCNNDNKIYDGAMVTLAKFTKNGLKVVQSRIGKVIRANSDNIQIQFTTTIGFDNKLYALITDKSKLKAPSALVLAYEEIQ